MACCGSFDTDKKLRMTQVVLYALSLITSLTTCISLGWSARMFYDNCPLFTDVRLTAASRNNTLLLSKALWHDFAICNVCIFSPTCGAIVAIVWFWFYILLSNFKSEVYNGIKIPPDIRLLLPSLTVNVPLAILSLIVACMITEGRAYFCKGVRQSLRDDCSVAGQREWSFPEDGRKGFLYMETAMYGAWLWFFSLSSKVIVVGIRVHRFFREKSSHALSTSISSYATSSDDELSSAFYDSDSDIDVKESNAGIENPMYVPSVGVLSPLHEEADIGPRPQQNERQGTGTQGSLSITSARSPAGEPYFLT